MSAFLVSDNHLQALVMISVYGVKESTALSGKWYGSLHFGHNGTHRACINTADLLGELLLRENEKSIAARYPNDKTPPAPAFRYVDVYPAPLVTAVVGLKLLDCYEYQACEHEGWDDSSVKRFCNSLRSSLTASLPGYDAAPWGLE